MEHVAGDDALEAREGVARFLERPGRALQVLDPAVRLLLAELPEIELARLVEVERRGDDAPVRPGPERDPGRPVDGHREHEAVVVVRVLADQVHAPRRAHDEGGVGAVPLPEGVGDPGLKGHASSWKSAGVSTPRNASRHYFRAHGAVNEARAGRRRCPAGPPVELERPPS
jgi:hypothetical protein